MLAPAIELSDEGLWGDDAVALFDPVTQEIERDALRVQGHIHPPRTSQAIARRFGSLDREGVAMRTRKSEALRGQRLETARRRNTPQIPRSPATEWLLERWRDRAGRDWVNGGSTTAGLGLRLASPNRNGVYSSCRGPGRSRLDPEPPEVVVFCPSHS